MNPDPREIARLPLPDDLKIQFETTVGELRQMLVAGAGSGSRKDLSLHEFADRIGRAVSTSRALCSGGKVTGAYKQNGRDWWIPESALEAYLLTQRGNDGRPKPRPRVRSAAPVKLNGWRAEQGVPPRQPAKRRAVG